MNDLYIWETSINLTWLIFFAFEFVYLMTIQLLACSSRKTRSHGPNAKLKPKLTMKHGVLKPGDADLSMPLTQIDVQDQAAGKLNSNTPATSSPIDDNKLKKDMSIATKEENKPVQSVALISGRKIPSAEKTGKTVAEKQSVEQHIPETNRASANFANFANFANGSVCRNNKDEIKTRVSGSKTKGSAQQTLADTQICDKLPKTSVDKVPSANSGYKIEDDPKIQIGYESEEESDSNLKDFARMYTIKLKNEQTLTLFEIVR